MLAAAHRGATGIRGHHTKDVDSTASEQASAHLFRQPHGYAHRAVSLLHQPEIAFDQAYARLDRPESAVYPDTAARSRVSHSGRRGAQPSSGAMTAPTSAGCGRRTLIGEHFLSGRHRPRGKTFPHGVLLLFFFSLSLSSWKQSALPPQSWVSCGQSVRCQCKWRRASCCWLPWSPRRRVRANAR